MTGMVDYGGADGCWSSSLDNLEGFLEVVAFKLEE